MSGRSDVAKRDPELFEALINGAAPPCPERDNLDRSLIHIWPMRRSKYISGRHLGDMFGLDRSDLASFAIALENIQNTEIYQGLEEEDRLWVLRSANAVIRMIRRGIAPVEQAAD